MSWSNSAADLGPLSLNLQQSPWDTMLPRLYSRCWARSSPKSRSTVHAVFNGNVQAYEPTELARGSARASRLPKVIVEYERPSLWVGFSHQKLGWRHLM